MRTWINNTATRLALGLLGGWLMVSPQVSLAVSDLNDDYNIFISGTNNPPPPAISGPIPGVGGFDGFDNPGNEGSYSISNATVHVNNLPLTLIIGSNPPITGFTDATFIGTMSVVVKAVDFNDGKVNAPYGANQITGNYVEGLSGTLISFSSSPQVNQRYELTFSFIGSGSNPAGFSKTCEIKDKVLNTVVASSCNYHVQNSNVAEVPEPGTLALLSLGLAVTALAIRRRQSPELGKQATRRI